MENYVAGPWQCTYCGKEIIADQGFIEINNGNPKLGSVHGHPIAPTTEDAPASAGPRSLHAALQKVVEPERNIRFRAFHDRCNPAPTEEGYHFPIGESATAEQWMRWVIHLGTKTWMGREDLVRMVEFYFINRNLEPHTGVEMPD